ncbi:MAG: ATP-binding protein [Bacillota bacterium]|nr:ATP-binding protein [Bacillota bacterium]
MKLAQKTLLYSVLVASGVVLLLLGWMIWLLPGVYLQQLQENAITGATSLHRHWLDTGSYSKPDEAVSQLPFGICLPDTGYRLGVETITMSADLHIEEPELRQSLDAIRSQLLELESMARQDSDPEISRGELDEASLDLDIPKLLRQLGLSDPESPFYLDIQRLDTGNVTFRDALASFRRLDDNGFVIFTRVEVGPVRYANIIALSRQGGSFYCTFVPTTLPRIEEIRSVVLRGLPMLIAVIALIILLGSWFFSRHIIDPIRHLARQADAMQLNMVQMHAKSPSLPSSGFALRGNDEITELGRELESLYSRLESSYRQLENEVVRQEILLRASSHQLKTPIAAALLLTESMIDRVGRYADHERYLPELRQQLVGLQRIVDQLLGLSASRGEPELAPVDLAALFAARTANMRELFTAHGLTVATTGALTVDTDAELITILIDNLLSNALQHTAAGGELAIELQAPGSVRIHNRPAAIPADLGASIFDAFVTGGDSHQGHGLGLYLVRWIARRLDIRVDLRNDGDGVTAELRFQTELEPQG